MVYNTKEFQYLQPKYSYLQTFKATTGKPIYPTISPPTTPPTQQLQQPASISTRAAAKDNSWWSLLKPYFKEYCNISSIHCFHYFTNNKLRYYEKY